MRAVGIGTLGLAMIGIALAGCGKREVCDTGLPGLAFAPVDAVWKPYLDLLPESATPCGHLAVFGAPNRRALNVDFATDDRPVDALLKHLESKGFQRSLAALENPDTQSIQLVRDRQTLRATTFLDKGRMRAVLELEEHDCSVDARRTTPGWTTCRGKKLVRCEPGTRLFATVEECASSCEIEGDHAKCQR